MKYDDSVFKKYYGFSYLAKIRGVLICCIISAVIITVSIAIDIQLPMLVAIILAGVLFVSVFPVLPLLFSYYIKAKKTSQRQRQWFENDILHVEMIPEDGFTWGAIVTHKKKYIVNHIANVTLNRKYIEIDGDVTFVDEYNGSITEKCINHIKIPRNFSNENQIIKLGEKNYG